MAVYHRSPFRWRPSATAVRMAGLLVVLAGLLGMHGLDTHGASPAGHMTLMEQPGATKSTPAVKHSPGSMGSSSRQLEGVSANVESPTMAVAVASAIPTMNIDMSMLALCLAILTAGVLALMWLLHRARTAPLLWIRPRLATTVERRGRDPDPPSLTVLSILRC